MQEALSGSIERLNNLYQEAKAINDTHNVINVQDDLDRSALFWSIKKGNIPTAELIIQLGADVNTATNEFDGEHEGTTPLMEASSHGYVSIVKKLVENGAHVNATKKDGTHAAYLAAENGYLNILNLLIQKNPNVADIIGYKGETPLIIAAINGHLEIVEFSINFAQREKRCSSKIRSFC